MVARARALLGVGFRPQGRDPERGLDCIGLVLAAADIAAERVPREYRIRGEHRAPIEAWLRDLGWRPVPEGELSGGDLILFEAGPAQLHLALCTGPGFIHADASLRRVVERPRPFPWPLASVWRPIAGDE